MRHVAVMLISHRRLRIIVSQLLDFLFDSTNVASFPREEEREELQKFPIQILVILVINFLQKPRY